MPWHAGHACDWLKWTAIHTRAIEQYSQHDAKSGSAHRLCLEGGLVCLLVLLLMPTSLCPSRASRMGTAGPKAAWGSCHQCTAGAWELLRPLLCPAARLSCPEAGRASAVLAATASSTCMLPLL